MTCNLILLSFHKSQIPHKKPEASIINLFEKPKLSIILEALEPLILGYKIANTSKQSNFLISETTFPKPFLLAPLTFHVQIIRKIREHKGENYSKIISVASLSLEATTSKLVSPETSTFCTKQLLESEGSAPLVLQDCTLGTICNT